MSKNHPNDNIYSILGKLEALKPTPEEKRFALVKEIRESVEAKGSVLQGVDAVQARLAKQFAESTTNEAIRVAGNTKGPVGHYSQMKYAQKDGTPDSQAHRAATAAMAKSARAAGSKLPMNKTTDPAGKQASGGYNAMTKGVTPVKIAEETCNECGMYESKCACTHANEGTGHQGLVAGKFYLVSDYGNGVGSHVFNSYDEARKHWGTLGGRAQDEYYIAQFDGKNLNSQDGSEQDLPEGETTRKPGVTTHRKTDFPGYPTDDGDDIEDTNKGKRGRPRKHAIKATKTDAEGNRLGRGRPKKDVAPKYSGMNDPFGRVPSKAPKSKVKGRVHSMGEAMSRLEQRMRGINEGINFAELLKEKHQTVEAMLAELQNDIKVFKETGACSELLKDCMEIKGYHGKMVADEAVNPNNPFYKKQNDYDLPPAMRGHGTADYKLPDVKAHDNIERDAYRDRAGLAPQQDSLEEELNELAKLAGLQTEGNAFSGKLAHTAKGDSFEQDGDTYTNRSSIADKELDEEETDEGNAFGQAVRNAKADGVQDGEKVEVDGKEIPVKESMEMPGSEESNFNISTNMSNNGDKNVTVTATGEHAATLLQMLRIAGLGDSQAAQNLQGQPDGEEGAEGSVEVIELPTQEVEVDETGFDEPATKPVNAPKPEYASMRASTMGPGEGDGGEKTMHPHSATKNNGDNALSDEPTRGQQVLKAVAALESKLAAEYESIKKISK